jgi:hypothetical protein
MCGKDWYNNHKSGHTCDSTGKRGAWIIKWIALLCILIS